MLPTMLAVLTLVALVGFGLLLYFSPSCATHRAMNFTRASLAMSLLAYGVSQFCMQMMIYDHGDDDWLAGAAIVKGIGWIALLVGIKGIFAILVTRADAKRKASRSSKVSSLEPDL